MKKIIALFKKLFKRVNSIFYVGATDILKPPLSKDKEEYFVKLKEEGNLKAKEVLIEHNLRLVVYLAKKYENSNTPLEDLVSIGNIGLIKGINTFSSSKNIRLATYCSRCIDNEILMYLRKNKKLKAEVSIDAPLSLDCDGNELHLEDVIGTDKDIVQDEIDAKNDKEIIYKCIYNLKPRDKEIMTLRYGLFGNREFTQKEVAEKLGISQSYISRIEKKVIKKLQTIINI